MSATEIKVEPIIRRGRPPLSEEAKLASMNRQIEYRKQYRLAHKEKLSETHKRFRANVIESKKYQCDKCDKCFTSKRSLDHHLFISKIHKQ